MEFLLSSSTSLFEHIGYVYSPEKKVGSLKTEMEQLKNKRDDVMRAVETAERRPMMRRKHEVNHWLVRVEMLEAEVSKMEKLEFKQDISWFRLWSRYQLSKLAVGMLEEAQDLNAKGGNFGEVADLRPLPVEEMPCPEFTVGFDSMLEQLHSLVQTTDVGIIGIHGMGGVGKTTLLNKFNNELITTGNHCFDVVIHIKVSENPHLGKLQKMIYSRLGLPWQEGDDQEERASHIRRTLSKVRFLLFLDDLWHELCLSTIGIPVPNSSNGCKIIIATRKVDVCAVMDAQKLLKVECLKQEDAWQLFLEKAGKEYIENSPIIRECGEKIVEKCGGLPLALAVVGCAMSINRSLTEGKHAVRSLDNAAAEIDGMEKVLRCLKRSYDDLPSEIYKLSFLYCSLFPKSDPQEDRIIRYWFAEGMIAEFEDFVEAREQVIKVLFRLDRASMIELTEDFHTTYARMHSMMRHMALWVASECGKVKNKWLVHVGEGLSKAPNMSRWTRAERVSLSDNKISRICTEHLDCSSLISLLLNNNKLLQSLSSNFFRSFQSLRLMALADTTIEELPAEIAMLTQLQGLDVCSTPLVSLPAELGKLRKLRYLAMKGTFELRDIPAGVIRSLSGSLQILELRYCYHDWEGGGKDGRLSWKELECLKQLQQLSITVTTSKTLRMLSNSDSLAQTVRSLDLLYLPAKNTIHFPVDFGLMTNLQRLCIRNLRDLQKIIIDNDSHLPVLNLESLVLSSLNTVEIKWKGAWPYGALNRLVRLGVDDCPRMNQLIGKDIQEDREAGRIVFPELRFMLLRNLPELTFISHSNFYFPSLKSLEVKGCPKLKRLPFGLQSCKRLKEIRGEMQWWEGLQWEDEGIKSTFLPRLRPML